MSEKSEVAAAPNRAPNIDTSAARVRQNPRLGEFIPTMQPDYASTAEVMERHGETLAEIKYDGYRVQVHKGKHSLKMFTRNGNELNYACYPDIVEIVKQLPTCIVDAEMVADGKGHKAVFDGVKQRFRREGIRPQAVQKYLDSGIVDEVPLHLRVFDTLRFERRGLLHLPYEERDSFTEMFLGQGIEIPDQARIATKVDLENFIQSAFDNAQEGVVCKDPKSIYTPGRKSTDWVKFKRSETLDLVVVGFYKSEHYCQDLPFTSVLVATYDEKDNSYETIGKVGVTRDDVAVDIYQQVGNSITQEVPANLKVSEKIGDKAPDQYIDPEHSVVLEVKAMNLNYATNWQTCGLGPDGKAFSMRIGFVDHLRYDKMPQQATTTDVVRKLYKLQEGI